MKWVCSVCGYVYEGSEPPKECPVCKAPASKFTKQEEGELKFADEHRIGVANGLDAEVVEGLRANFTGECTEVGMYLAMSRQADREGYPELALAKRAKELGYDAIHDTVHEMCKDEARHGKAFNGLLKRYF